MYQFRLTNPSLRYSFIQKFQQKRNVQVSVIGASNSVGAKLALQLKQNLKITKLKLYDFDDTVFKVTKDLDQIPGGPPVTGYTGDDLKTAITMSDLILMVCNSNSHGESKSDIAIKNAPSVKSLCEAMAERNPDAMLGISTKPINSMVPFACAMLYKYKCFNPFKVFGLTNIDVARAKSYAAQALQANPRHLTIPVIGGRSEETVIPLFSNLLPNFYYCDDCTADNLIRMVRKAEIIKNMHGAPRASIALAWSINDCSEKLVDALWGSDVELHCYSANPGFGTRFFAGPVLLSQKGITRTFNNFNMSSLECNLLADSIGCLNRDIEIGEKLASQYD